MFNFKKQQQLSEKEKNTIKQVSLFYEMHNDILKKFSNSKKTRNYKKNIWDFAL